jgi:hypothetical protein
VLGIVFHQASRVVTTGRVLGLAGAAIGERLARSWATGLGSAVCRLRSVGSSRGSDIHSRRVASEMP